MSRIGKQPINLDNSIKLSYTDSILTILGTNGKLKINVPSELTLDITQDQLFVKVKEKNRNTGPLWGLTRSLINNMVTGVKSSFVKKLLLVGPGYKALIQGNCIVLRLGYSHDIIYSYPKSITLKCPKDNIIEIYGCDKQLVGQVAAEIRDFRKPDPYKGKGVKYSDEVVIRKKGKDSKK